jgi:hypothetical protein
MPNIQIILGGLAAILFAAMAAFGWLYLGASRDAASAQTEAKLITDMAAAQRLSANQQIGLQNEALGDLRKQAAETQRVYEGALAEARQRSSAATAAASTVMGRKPATTDLCAEASKLIQEQQP